MPSSQILPLLWVGDEYTASAPELHAFGYILNITIEVDKCSLLADDVIFQRFPIFDYGGEKQQQAMLCFFREACSVLEQGMASGQPVLVHCVEGKQRSCAVVAAYLMFAMGLTPLQAKDYIFQRLPEAFDGGRNVNSAPALELWEKSMSRISTERKSHLVVGTCSSSEGLRVQKPKYKKTVPPKNARKLR